MSLQGDILMKMGDKAILVYELRETYFNGKTLSLKVNVQPELKTENIGNPLLKMAKLVLKPTDFAFNLVNGEYVYVYCKK